MLYNLIVWDYEDYLFGNVTSISIVGMEVYSDLSRQRKEIHWIQRYLARTNTVQTRIDIVLIGKIYIWKLERINNNSNDNVNYNIHTCVCGFSMNAF